MIVISYEGDIAGFDADRVKRKIKAVVDAITPDMIRIDPPVPAGFDHRRPKGIRLADADARPIEVYINEDEYISLSESESSSDGTTSDASVTGASRQEHIDDAKDLLPKLIRRRLGHNRVALDDILIKFYKQGSVVVCLEMACAYAEQGAHLGAHGRAD